MIDNKKEQEREELHRTIWNMANELRGSVDGWDFKQYVLGMLFYRYISENSVRYVNAGEIEAGNADFDYVNLFDSGAEPAREELVDTKGYFILPSELFCNVREKAPQDENLNGTLEKVFRNIESSAQGHDSEDDLKGLFDDLDVNSNKLGGTVEKRNAKLVKLLNGVAEMKLGDYQDNTINAFGALLIPTQVGMIASITVIFGFDVNKSVITALLSSSIGAGGAAILGKTVATNIIKFIPGVGTVVGGAISAGTAGVITAALGEAYIGVMEFEVIKCNLRCLPMF